MKTVQQKSEEAGRSPQEKEGTPSPGLSPLTEGGSSQEEGRPGPAAHPVGQVHPRTRGDRVITASADPRRTRARGEGG